MSKFVAIVKTHGEIPRTHEHRHMPDDWPALCEEFEAIEEALAKHPGRPVLSVEDYAHFAKGMALAHKFLPKKKRGWFKRLFNLK